LINTALGRMRVIAQPFSRAPYTIVLGYPSTLHTPALCVRYHAICCYSSCCCSGCRWRLWQRRTTAVRARARHRVHDQKSRDAVSAVITTTRGKRYFYRVPLSSVCNENETGATESLRSI